MANVSYTKNQLLHLVRFVDQKTFTVYEGKLLALLGCAANGGIPSELSMNQVLALRGMNTIHVYFDGRVEELAIEDASVSMEEAGKRWLTETHGLEFDKLPDGDPIEEFPQSWLAESAVYLDENESVIYRGTNLDLLIAGFDAETWRLTPEQILRDNGETMDIQRGCVGEETYGVVVVTEDMRARALESGNSALDFLAVISM